MANNKLQPNRYSLIAICNFLLIIAICNLQTLLLIIAICNFQRFSERSFVSAFEAIFILKLY